MNTPARPSSVRSTLAMTGLAIVTAAYFALPAYAAAPDPAMPTISIVGVNKGDDKVKLTPIAPAKNSGNNNSNSSNSRGGNNTSNSSRTTTTKGDVTYIIQIRNSGKIPAKGLTVAYTFYNLTTNTTNGESTNVIQPITGSESIDLDPNKVKDVETVPISHSNTQSLSSGSNNSSGGGGRGGRTMTTPTSTSSITKVLGSHVEVLYNDKVLKTRNEPDNIDDLVKKYSPKG